LLTILNSLHLVQGQIDTASEFVDQKLNALINRLLFANMIIMLLTMSATFAAVTGTFFGMNVSNHLEETPSAFKRIVIYTVGGAVLSVILALQLLMCTGTVPRTSIISRPSRFKLQPYNM
jgi:uncharacterized membrane protein YjdF